MDPVWGGDSGRNWDIRRDRYTPPCVKQTDGGNLLYSRGSTAWRSIEMGGREGGRCYTYTYSWFTSLYSRDQHNIVKQLYSSLIKVKLDPYLITCMRSRFSHAQLFGTPWTVSCQAPLSTGFSRQEYWSELPFPSPGDFSNPGIKLLYVSCIGRRVLYH